MIVELVCVNQTVELAGSAEVSFSITLQLPNGSTVAAPVNADDVQTILNCQVDQPPPTAEYQPPIGKVVGPTSRPPPSENVPTPPDPAEWDGYKRVAWRELSSDVINDKMKGILGAIGLPEEVSVEELEETLQKVGKAQVNSPPTPPAQPAAQPTTVSGIGKVMWHDSPVVMNKPPIRTVPKDDFGYPIVNQTDQGEVVGQGDVDEDGVGQL